MTNDDRIKGHFSAIAAHARSWGRSDSQARVKFIRKQLNAIEYLLQEPEPETLAASVLRLTERCNQLELERDRKSEDLEAAGKQVSALQVTVAELRGKLKQFQIGLCPYDCATVETLARLRAEAARQDELLKEAEKHTRRLSRAYEKDLAVAEALLNVVNEKLAQYRMGWSLHENELAKLRAEVARQNELLDEAQLEIDKQNKYIELLRKAWRQSQ